MKRLRKQHEPDPSVPGSTIIHAAQVTTMIEAGQRARLGDVLVSENLVTPEQLSASLNLQQESGRQLGAIPGPITSANSAGCHRLLAEGLAEVTTSVGDVEAMLDPTPAAYQLPPAYQSAARRTAPDPGRGAGRPAL